MRSFLIIIDCYKEKNGVAPKLNDFDNFLLATHFYYVVILLLKIMETGVHSSKI